MKDDVRRWRVLALLGGLLAFSVLFIHVPAALWAGNLAEFHSSPAALLGFGLLGAGVCLLVVFLLSRLLSRRLQRLLACLLTALGVTWWLYGLLLVGRMHALNGVAVPIQISHRTAVLELGAVALFLIAAGVAAARYREIAIRLLAILNAGLLVATTIAVVSARPPAPQIAPAGPPSALFRFSTRTNVVVVLLDGLQADLASSVIHENPRLEAALDGFVFYKDTLGVAPTTLLSLPAIHSGVAYETGGIGPYFTSSVERSFLTLFSKAGYEASVINPLLGVCTPGLAACVAASGLLPPRALSDQLSPLRLEAIRLLDLSLFRVAPFALKPRIYNGGRGTVAVVMGSNLSQLAQLALESNSALDALSSRLTATDGPPTIKFVHSLATHMPYVIGEDCTTVGPKDLAKTRSQARCGLEAAVRLLERLKKERIYDRTVVLLMADHGISPQMYPDTTAGSREEWWHIAESANPLFMLKPLDSHGPLRAVPGPVQLVDVGATLCEAASACVAPHGYPAGHAPPNRPRRFSQYVWDDRLWQSMTIPGLTRYDVLGPLDQQGSWQRVE